MHAQLKHLNQLSNIGGGWYGAGTGWTFDTELLNLVGIDSPEQVLPAINRLVLSQDRTTARTTYRWVLAASGRRTMQYRPRHGKIGQPRHANRTCEAVVDPDRKLPRAVVTHTYITDAVTAREGAERARATAARRRTPLMCRVSDAIPTRPRRLGRRPRKGPGGRFRSHHRPARRGADPRAAIDQERSPDLARPGILLARSDESLRS